ncbi:MAG: Asp-tRNA(Asn)/Glu-tRNA(Gln) amidotransferase subunit GatB [Peptococcaceae bacterium]|nr:Asp-tRNA(Asn)/Glu-tRNA(Gln) amidotransferase subunit GatB [Peptococcaceae bacterium]
MRYELVMGLEVHVEMATQSKLFCTCSAAFGAEPNENVCPACSGMPGLLPVLNKRAVELAIAAGLVTNCRITPRNTFDKKNYYYPDLPTSYQITQFYAPICTEGHVDITTAGAAGAKTGAKTIGIKQIHIEEDAGKLLHDAHTDQSLIDYNRAGVPLIEIVSHPDFRSADEALAYLEKLRAILRYAGVSDCKMEEGSMRADINISVRKPGASEFGVRTEIKNMNSLKAIARAIDYEYHRHVDALEQGTEELVQETRRWDDLQNRSFAMRTKENATDYLYFPNPDIAPIEISEEWIETVRRTLPEMPDVKKARYMEEYALSDYDSTLLAAGKDLADLFEATHALYPEAKEIANWINGELLAHMKKNSDSGADTLRIDAPRLAQLLKMVGDNQVNRLNAKKIFAAMYWENADPTAYSHMHNMINETDDTLLTQVIRDIINANPKSVDDYKSGKLKAKDFLFGQAMRTLRGNGDPAIIRRLLEEALN